MCACGNIVARSRNYFHRGITISIIYSEYESVALFSRCAMRMRRIILLPSACPSPQYYSALTHKRHDLGRREGGGGGKLLNTKYVF